MVPLVERLGERELIVLITHPDSDHLGGTAELLAARPGARVLAGALDVPLVGNPERIVRDRYARFAVHDDVPFGEAAAERAFDRAGPSFAGTEAVPRTPAWSSGAAPSWSSQRRDTAPATSPRGSPMTGCSSPPTRSWATAYRHATAS